MYNAAVKVNCATVATVTHPTPRAPWFLHLGNEWRWDTPDVPRRAGWRFRTRKALLAFLRAALDGAGDAALTQPLHIGDRVRWNEKGRWRRSVIAPPSSWHQPDDPVPTEDGTHVPVAELQVMVTGHGGTRRWEPAVMAL